MGVITYNGLKSSDYGIQVEKPPGYHVPALCGESTHIAGLNGDILTPDGSFNNVSRSYDVSFGEYNGDFQPQVDRLLSWYFSNKISTVNPFEMETRDISYGGYTKLSDSYDEDHFRMAIAASEIDIENILGQGGRFTLEFNCKPQRWLNIGSIVTTVSQTGTTGLTLQTTNPTSFIAKPLYKITEDYAESHFITVTYRKSAGNLENLTFLIKPGFGTMIVDCELKDCYYGDTNLNNYITISGTTSWPMLPPGDLTITTDRYLSVMEVVPRWWTI